jgi:hypothetical protein
VSNIVVVLVAVPGPFSPLVTAGRVTVSDATAAVEPWNV